VDGQKATDFAATISVEKAMIVKLGRKFARLVP